MSEDPVKYETLNEKESRAEEGMKFVKALSQDAADRSAKQQIRIEALRAAATVMHGVELYGTQETAPPTHAELTLTVAKQFTAYLESGE